MIITTHDVSKNYGTSSVLSRVNLQVKPGRIYGLLGKNGAGKTTLMKILLGLSRPSAGHVELFGKALQGNKRDVYPRVGSLVNGPSFYPNLTAVENLEILCNLRGKARPDAVQYSLDLVGLSHAGKKEYGKFSLGMKQRLGLAAALIHDPELLILDEPVNGLDATGVIEIRKFLRHLATEKQKTILISSHILGEMEQLIDDVGILREGALVEQCSYDELIAKCKKYYLLQVSSTTMGCRLLESKLSIHDYHVEDQNRIKIFDQTLSVSEIVKALVAANVDVLSAQACGDNLETYFSEITA